MDRKTSLLDRGISSNHGPISGLLSSHALMVTMLLCMTANAAEPEINEQEEPPPSKKLDLKAPDITKILSAEELERLVKGNTDPDTEEVKVEGARDLSSPDTPVWPGLLAPFWAVTHPTQAWRIFAPLPSDQVKDSRN